MMLLLLLGKTNKCKIAKKLTETLRIVPFFKFNRQTYRIHLPHVVRADSNWLLFSTMFKTIAKKNNKAKQLACLLSTSYQSCEPFTTNLFRPSWVLQPIHLSECIEFPTLKKFVVKHLSLNVLYFVHLYVTYHVNRQKQ